MVVGLWQLCVRVCVCVYCIRLYCTCPFPSVNAFVRSSLSVCLLSVAAYYMIHACLYVCSCVSSVHLSICPFYAFVCNTHTSPILSACPFCLSTRLLQLPACRESVCFSPLPFRVFAWLAGWGCCYFITRDCQCERQPHYPPRVQIVSPGNV